MDDRSSILDRGMDFFLFATSSGPPLGPTHPPLHWVPGTLSPWVKQQGRGAEHSLPFGADAKNV